MTLEEMKMANHGHFVKPTHLDFDAQPNKCAVTPANEFNESFPRPLEDADYNHVPLAQQEELARTSQMDQLHRMDAMASDLRKGKQLKAIHDVDVQTYGKEKGTQNFLNRFKHERKN